MKKIRSNRPIVVFGCIIALLVASEVNVLAQINENNKEQTITANWIWQEEDGPQDTWLCLRKTIELPGKPKDAIAKISADSKYWLWINGKLVVFEGQLKRDRLNETYYDEINLSSYLKKGKNTIAALVWYWGREGFSHHDSGKGGFLFDAHWTGQNIYSDPSWKIMKHPGYEHSVEGGQPNMRLSVWNVRFNKEKDNIEGWQQPNFDDSGWQRAIVKGVANDSPWDKLVKRPFPQWKDSGLQTYANASDLPSNGNKNIIEGVLPYNARVSAYLKVKASAGQIIHIQTDQYDGWYDFNEGPANRAEFITAAGVQEFETLVWMSGNTVQYRIPKGIEIIDLKYRELGYPSEFSGSFSCDDPFYNKLWEMARRTLYINMYDNFMDCPDRERALWWGDVVNQSGECFYSLDTTSHALIKKSMRTLINWQREDSTLLSPPSTKWTAELPQQMLASIGWYGFWNYFLNTNDSLAIQEAYPAVKKYLGIWELDADGLVKHRTGAWDWGDWGTNIDIAILDNTWYYLALKAAIPMAEICGMDQDTHHYSIQMKSIKDNFSRVFWNKDEQYFKSDNLFHADDRANAMAVLAGLAEESQYRGVSKVLNENRYASPYMEKYVLEALCQIGSESLALARMKDRYEEMVDSEYSTLWEVWSGLKEGTINHGWNAPNTVLSQKIAGINPIEPGWSKFEVLPQLGYLSDVKQVVPSVKGNIKVHHKVESNHFITHLESPQNTEAVVGVPIQNGCQSISVNGKIAWSNGKRNNLKSVSGIVEDGKYIKLTLLPGKWRIKATYN